MADIRDFKQLEKVVFYSTTTQMGEVHYLAIMVVTEPKFQNQTYD